MSTQMDQDIPAVKITEALRQAKWAELEARATAVLGDKAYFSSKDMEALTGTKASTWRYWTSVGEGPQSFMLGRHRVWRRESAIQWLIDQELGA